MNTRTFDVLTIGNATIDAFLTLQDASTHCRINPETSELCVPCGEKIPLEKSEFLVGGNAANVAVGLARSGYHTAFMAELGEDEFAAKITNTLTQEGIDLSSVQHKGASTFAIGLQFQNERTLFVQHHKREHAFSFDELSTKWIYLTSIGNIWETAYENVLTYVTQTGAMLACNPGTVQIHAGKDTVVPVLKKARVVFLNKEEAQYLWGLTEQPVTEIVKKIREDVPGLLVITDAKEGAYAYSEQNELSHIPAMDCTIVEKTGAGDGFAAGFLSALMRDESLETCLKYGTLNAVAVIGAVGAQPGILKKDAYMEKLAAAPAVEKI